MKKFRKFSKCQECGGSQGQNFSEIFFFHFWFRMIQFAKKSKKKFWKFLGPGPPFWVPFDPYLENQSFFGHAVFSKWSIPLRRFFYQHLNKIVRVVCSQKSKNINLGPILPLLGQKKGDPYFFGKSSSITFFHIWSPVQKK